ncbi:hypothetical protein [Microbulbifer sp.]|uniref:hypothetical protein n=1 Tax=Microbulbifer sp. TaxID=1908541 RepID=UPI00258794A1|nr:hypothetical protein [Microbulbifer sp.]
MTSKSSLGGQSLGSENTLQVTSRYLALPAGVATRTKCIEATIKNDIAGFIRNLFNGTKMISVYVFKRSKRDAKPPPMVSTKTKNRQRSLKQQKYPSKSILRKNLTSSPLQNPLRTLTEYPEALFQTLEQEIKW